MFNTFLEIVKSPEFVIDSCNLALAWGELPDFTSKVLELSMEDILNFHIDMIMGEISLS